MPSSLLCACAGWSWSNVSNVCLTRARQARVASPPGHVAFIHSTADDESLGAHLRQRADSSAATCPRTRPLNCPGARGDTHCMKPVLNDVHSQLNITTAARIERPENLAELQALVKHAASQGLKISVAGGRHAMGGQQFAEGSLHIDT